MIRVLFFASIREAVGTSALEMEYSDALADVAALRSQLVAANDEPWSALTDDNVVLAVNQAVVEPDHPLRDGDEVAFFPPVTGG